MEKFTELKSTAAPWLVPDVNTDIITPMKRVLLNMEELEKYCFEPYRFVDGDGDKGVPDMNFPLNQERYKGAKIMLTGENFGCGSSRETAPEAIRRCGIKCLIGSSFGGIFWKNCFQQGILPIILEKQEVESLASQAGEGKIFVINLASKMICAPDGARYMFDLEENRYDALLNGWDDVDLTLKKIKQIQEFFRKDAEKRFWLYETAAV